jgi:hypothetical protein
MPGYTIRQQHAGQWQDVGVLDPNSSPDPGLPLFGAAALTRRRMLADGGRGLLALALVGMTSTACGSSQPSAPDPLEAELAAARSDSDLAAAAAKAGKPAFAPALNEIAAERARHAAALQEELSRAAGKPIPTTAETPTGTTAGTAAGSPSPARPAPPSVRDVSEALRTSAERITKLVPSLSGYRAGLMGSIAAACTAAVTVSLARGTSPR